MIAAGGLSVLLGVLFTIGFVHHVRELNIPAEDVRSETFAVAAKYHARRCRARQRIGELRILLLLAPRAHDVSPRPVGAGLRHGGVGRGRRLRIGPHVPGHRATGCVTPWIDGATPAPALTFTSSVPTSARSRRRHGNAHSLRSGSFRARRRWASTRCWCSARRDQPCEVAEIPRCRRAPADEPHVSVDRGPTGRRGGPDFHMVRVLRSHGVHASPAPSRNVAR